MTADRCAYLCLVAIANKLEESWQALFPLIIVTYFTRNHAYLISKLVYFVMKYFNELFDQIIILNDITNAFRFLSVVDVKRITNKVRGTRYDVEDE